eukprot:14526919-Alexandrium_andersonii.AAC.1
MRRRMKRPRPRSPSCPAPMALRMWAPRRPPAMSQQVRPARSRLGLRHLCLLVLALLRMAASL